MCVVVQDYHAMACAASCARAAGEGWGGWGWGRGSKGLSYALQSCYWGMQCIQLQCACGTVRRRRGSPGDTAAADWQPRGHHSGIFAIYSRYISIYSPKLTKSF